MTTDHSPSSAEFKQKVELYLYSTSGPLWPVMGWPLPLPLHKFKYSFNARIWHICFTELLCHSWRRQGTTMLHTFTLNGIQIDLLQGSHWYLLHIFTQHKAQNWLCYVVTSWSAGFLGNFWLQEHVHTLISCTLHNYVQVDLCIRSFSYPQFTAARKNVEN